MEPRLADLAGMGRISARDLDVVVVANGVLSRAAVTAYLDARPRGSSDLPTVAREITERICGCQYHDGGYTELKKVDQDHAVLRVGGACVSCPQIVYTAGIVKSAILHRISGAGEVTIEGTEHAREGSKPPNSQLTMAMLMRRSGMTFADLDGELDRLGELDDEDLVRLAQRCLLRRRVAEGS